MRLRLAAFVAGSLAALLATLPAGAETRFSDGYRPPASKQGVSEFRTAMPADDLAARTAKLKALGTAYVQYNLFWSELESAGVPSSAAPLACPAGHARVPADAAEQARLGFKRYRCIDRAVLARFDALLARDEAAGFQSGAVLWSSAPQYRDPACPGSPGAPGQQGCVPRDDALDDFEDYVNLVASRWNGGQRGKLSHFIVWNEAASPVWFDMAPRIDARDPSTEAVEGRIEAYGRMMVRAHAALQRHQRRALLYASTDALWAPGLAPGHYGSMRLVDGLWARLGPAYSWSLAVHPYGDVDRPARRGQYSFANLDGIAAHQGARLAERGMDPASPQAWLLASEQGWGLGPKGREGQARQVCLAHERALALPRLVAVAHNYFQSIEPDEGAGTSSQGAYFGLLPNALPNSLAGMEAVPTGRALAATMNPAAWGRPGNYCCDTAGVGCPLP